MRPLVGRATYLGPYNVPRTSRPATNAGCGLLVVSFSPSGTGAREGPTFHQLGGLQLEARASWSGGPAAEAAQTECCSCSTAPVGLRESVGRRPPRRAHPPYSHGQDHPCKNLPACQHSLALPPAGRVVEPGGERVEPPVRSADCTSRLGPQHSRQRTAERADWRTGRRPPADLPASAVQGCSRCQLTPTSQWTACSVSHHLMRTLFISDCISASWASFANPGCNLAAAVDSEPCGAVA